VKVEFMNALADVGNLQSELLRMLSMILKRSGGTSIIGGVGAMLIIGL